MNFVLQHLTRWTPCGECTIAGLSKASLARPPPYFDKSDLPANFHCHYASQSGPRRPTDCLAHRTSCNWSLRWLQTAEILVRQWRQSENRLSHGCSRKCRPKIFYVVFNGAVVLTNFEICGAMNAWMYNIDNKFFFVNSKTLHYTHLGTNTFPIPSQLFKVDLFVQLLHACKCTWLVFCHLVSCWSWSCG